MKESQIAKDTKLGEIVKDSCCGKCGNLLIKIDPKKSVLETLAEGQKYKCIECGTYYESSLTYIGGYIHHPIARVFLSIKH